MSLVAYNYSMTILDISMMIEAPVCTHERTRSNGIMSGDISEILVWKLKDQEEGQIQLMDLVR